MPFSTNFHAQSIWLQCWNIGTLPWFGCCFGLYVSHSHWTPRHKFAYCVLERLNCFIPLRTSQLTPSSQNLPDKKCQLGKCQLFGQVTDLLQSFRLDLQSETLLLINIKELLMSSNGINQDMTTKNEEEEWRRRKKRRREFASAQINQSPGKSKRAVLWGLLFWH